MSWLASLWSTPSELNAEQRAKLDAYRALSPIDDETHAAAPRYVVVDVETSGLRPHADRLLAIGALTVTGGRIRFDEVFSALLRQDTPSPNANILIHRIDGTTQTSAAEPAEALTGFLEFARNSPLIAFHAGFDRVFVNRATRTALGITPGNVWLDLAQLAPAFFPEHARHAQSLDDWTRIFGIENYLRHDAIADALATAQLLQVVLARAAQSGVTRLSGLASHANAQRWLQLQHR